ncbi:MAG TPA: META domain-containing protein [Acidimicrobiales bacterium]|nr:META domain-containing protein [Acidimicrobiales bacterium]
MRSRFVVLLLCSAVALACGDDGGDDLDAGPGDSGGGATEPADGAAGATEPAPAADPLAGRTFVATEMTEDGAPRPLVEGTELRLAFAEDELRISAGCNSISRSYRFTGSGIELGDEAAATLIGCDPAREAQDEWITEVLSGSVEAEVDGDTLVLTSGATTLTLLDRETASPDVPLVGTTWTLDTVLEGTSADGTASSVPGPTATLTLAADGTYVLDTGCNTGSGTVEVADGTLAFAAPELTRAACEGDTVTTEAAVVALLDGEVAYEIEERRLTLTAGDRGLGFAAA